MHRVGRRGQRASDLVARRH